jgi:hypothetical protein
MVVRGSNLIFGFLHAGRLISRPCRVVVSSATSTGRMGFVMMGSLIPISPTCAVGSLCRFLFRMAQ